MYLIVVLEEAPLTSVDWFWCLLIFRARIVFSRCLGMDPGGGAVFVEVALLVHRFLESLVLPAKDVITVGGGTTESYVSLPPNIH